MKRYGSGAALCFRALLLGLIAEVPWPADVRAATFRGWNCFFEVLREGSSSDALAVQIKKSMLQSDDFPEAKIWGRQRQDYSIPCFCSLR